MTYHHLISSLISSLPKMKYLSVSNLLALCALFFAVATAAADPIVDPGCPGHWNFKPGDVFPTKRSVEVPVEV